MKHYLGIDGGIHGGFTLIDEQGNAVYSFEMPIIKGERNIFDIKAIANDLAGLVESYPDMLVCVEKAAPRPIQGVKQAFITGYGFGILCACLVSLEIPFIIVDPKTWQKKILPQSTGDTKTVSKLFATQRCPEHNWCGNGRQILDGLTDAYGIAMYARMVEKKGD